MPEKLRYLVALLVIREKVIKPVLAGAGEIKRGPKPKNILPINAHYHALQMEMHNLFRTIKIAA